MSSRRNFIKMVGATGMALTAGASPLSALGTFNTDTYALGQRYGANDRIRLGIIGVGIMGHANLQAALQVPGVELVAACDLYTGRLERMRELYGNELFLTRDYRALLDRRDIDAVIVATTDVWHARICIEALGKGKHVYCEKPIVHKIAEGLPFVEAAKKSAKIVQIGSQGVSSLTHQKAREWYLAGEIGNLNTIEATFDRHSALGAWQYTLPNDVSAQTVDWERYITGMPALPFDAKKFFWWRNYSDFGTGASGDLFVHLLTSIHMVIGSLGPERIFSSGQLSYWKDGRDVPDVMTAILDYPETDAHPAFQLTLRVNFTSGAGEKFAMRFIGDEGVMDLMDFDVTVHHDLLPKAPGIGDGDALYSYPEKMQEQLLAAYDRKYSAADKVKPTKEPLVYHIPKGHNEHYEHFFTFFDAIRNGKTVLEDAEFGFRAAAPCLACNDSYYSKEIVHWDPMNMKVSNVKS